MHCYIREGDFFQNVGKDFDGKTDALICACEKLKGKKMETGDVSYELHLFPFLPMILRFWESDEDFPASLQILVDKNILDYMHYETLMFAISHLLNRLKDEMCKKELNKVKVFSKNEIFINLLKHCHNGSIIKYLLWQFAIFPIIYTSVLNKREQKNT